MNNENVFTEILAEAYNREFSRFDTPQEIKTSKRHNRAMKRIFRLYRKNTEHLRNTENIGAVSKISEKRPLVGKRLLVVVVLIFLALITGFTAAYFISKGFRGKVHSDNTELFPINYENAPETIEKKYYLAGLSEDFELIDMVSTPFDTHYYYKNSLIGQTVSFSQRIKNNNPYHFNTENHKLEEVVINGNYGVYLDRSNESYIYGAVIWDNGEYILEISAHLSKTDLLDLAESVKATDDC